MNTASSVRPIPHVKRDWERLYRAAVLESDPGKLLLRIQDAEDAILERFERLSDRQGHNGKEHDALTRAQHILGMLRQAGQER